MDAILNNPFRILGLPTTASDKEIAKRVSDLLIYAEMGKKVSYETDFLFLGELDRSTEAITLAAKRIELPENKIFYSLLCFDLKDNFERESIEFIKQGDFSSAYNLLNNAIEENSPNDFITWQGKDQISLLKKISIVDNDDYSIQKAIPPPNIDTATSIFYSLKENKNISIKFKYGVDIIETNSQISFTDKYQISCTFKWISPIESQEKKIGLKFKNYSNEEYEILVTQHGKLMVIKSNILEFEKVIDEGLLYEKKSNRLAVQRFDKYIEVKLNEKSIFKNETNEIFQSFLLHFLGRQNLLIEDLFISGLTKKGLGTGAEINERTFSYTKNYALSYLILILQSKKIGSSLFNYFYKIGNIFKQEYFINYTKEVISKNYICDFAALTDIFVKEFYFSLNHLVDLAEEGSQFELHGSFAPLSKDAEQKVKDLSMGSKPYIFENFIKEISSKRSKEPNKAFDYACELKNEATHFYNWYSEFYGFGNLVSKSLSDKIGTELIECAIAYYNAISPKTTELAQQSLKLLTWASDFAFNQALRDRINESISILQKAYPNTEYKIVDFELKDKTRSTRRVTPKDKPVETKSYNAPKKETITSNIPKQEPINSKKEEESKKNKSKTNINQTIYIPIKKPNIGKQIFQKLRKIEPVYFLYGLILMIVLIVILQPDNKQHSASNNKRYKESQPINIKEENTSPDQNIVKNILPINRKPNLNIDLSHYKPREQESEAIQESKWKGNKLNNGDSPYNEYFGKGIYDYNSECYLIFKNGYSTDAIVCLENTATGRTIRNEYIQAGTDYKMTNIPEGIYKVKSFSGNDWNPEKTLNHGQIIGAFDTDLSFSTSDKPSDLIQMSITKTGDGISYSTGEITLYRVSHGNMQQRNINSDEFFK